jgi:hypothetical protein
VLWILRNLEWSRFGGAILILQSQGFWDTFDFVAVEREAESREFYCQASWLASSNDAFFLSVGDLVFAGVNKFLVQ